jgi:hypothetical protein
MARSLLRDALVGARLRWILAAGCAAPLLVLALPVPDGSPAVSASFVVRVLALLTWAFALTVPPFLASPRRDAGHTALFFTRPLGAPSLFLGRVLACLGLVAAWWLLLALAGWAAVEVRRAGCETPPPVPRRRIVAAARDPARLTLVPGDGPARFRFEGLREDDFPPGPLRAEVRPRFTLVRQEPGLLGLPLTARVTNPRTGASRSFHNDRPLSRRPWVLSVPRSLAFPGDTLHLDVSLGPSPFRVDLSGGTVALLGRGAGLFASFAASALAVLSLAVALTVFSCAAAQGLSPAVAAFLGLAVWFAGETAGFAGASAATLLRTLPSSGGTGAGGDLTGPVAWYLHFVRSAGRLFPDFAAFNPARILAEGYEVAPGPLAESALQAAILAAALFGVGSVILHRRRRESP